MNIRQRGEFDDLPRERHAAGMELAYPGLIVASRGGIGNDFERETLHEET